MIFYNYSLFKYNTFSVNSTFCVTKPQLLPRRSVMPKLEDFHFSDDLRSQLLRDMEISGKYSSKPPPIAPSVSMTYTSKASNTPSGQLIDETQNPFGSASSLKVSPGMFGKTEAIKSPEAGRAISKRLFLYHWMDFRAIP